MQIEKEFHDFQDLIVEAGLEAKAYFDSDANPNVQKADGSIVTEIDQSIEAKIRAFIAERFPNDTIIGEEEDTVHGDSEYVWYIDPIDGTDNFVRKVPFFAVTVARLGPSAEGSFAIVHNPVSGQVFASLMEDGAYENKNLCNLTADPIGGSYFISVTAKRTYADWAYPMMYKLREGVAEEFGKSGHFRSSLLDLAYVAAGRLDGFLSVGHHPWDCAAGLYLIKAAGGVISYWDESGWHRYDGAIKDFFGEDGHQQPVFFVSHPDIHDQVLDFVGDLPSWAKK